MATTVGQHSVAAFTSPVNGTTPIDANTVRGNDNTVRVAYVDHDADPGIHVQSSTLASRPAAGTAGRKWITEDSGVYTLWFDDGTNWHPVSSENVALTVLAGENLVKGDVVKVTGWNNGQDLPEVSKVASASDVAFAVMTAAVSSGSMGYATNTGIVQDLATNSFSVGAILYPNTSGGFTATKPTSGTYQACAYVLRSNANNGVLYVEFSAPRIVESSSNTASTVVQRDASGNFSAGTITAGALTSTGLVTFASLKGTGATTVTNILDEDNMASDSATALATQQSIKAYVDAKVATVDTLAEVLANGNTTGANDIVVNSGQKIRTPLVAAQDGTSAITIANTTGALTLNTALADSNLATISTAGKVANSATTATSANTASAIVARDASGNFSAGTITAALTGNASTATTLQTARNINGVSFNGSADITVTAAAGTLTGTTLASGVTASSLTSVGTLTSLTVSGTTTVSGGGASATPYTTLNGLRLSGGDANNTIWGDTRQISITNSNSFIYLAPTSNGGTQGLAVNTTNGNVTAYNALTVSGATNVATASAATKIGLGTASPDASFKVTISGNSGTTTPGIFFDDQAASPKNYVLYTNGSKNFVLRNHTDALNIFEATSAGNVAFDTNTLYVDAVNNRVGVGTASPATALHTYASGTVISQVETGTQYAITRLKNPTHSSDVGVDNTSLYMDSGGAYPIIFYTGSVSTERMRLDASGNLGLGVTPQTGWGANRTTFQVHATTQPNVLFTGNPTNGGAIWTNGYYDGAANRYIANGAASLFSTGNGGFQWFNAPSGTAGNTFTLTQAMTLDASGSLSVTGNGRFQSGGSNWMEFSANVLTSNQNDGAHIRSVLSDATVPTYSFKGDQDTGIFTAGANILAFTTGSTERARITSGGNLLVGETTYGSRRFSVSGTSGEDVVISSDSSRAQGTGWYLFYGTSDTNTTLQAWIRGDGTYGSRPNVYGGTSDAKLKQDIIDSSSQWDDIKAVRVRKFRFKDDPSQLVQIGVVAQELEQTSPGLVEDAPDYEEIEVTDEDGNVTTERKATGTVTKSVKYSILYMKSIKALQEAMARIEALEARLEALEA